MTHDQPGETIFTWGAPPLKFGPGAVDEIGHVLYSGDEMSAAFTALTNDRYRHIVLAQAAARFPELAQLRPTRRPEDPVCPSCRGAGGVAQYPQLICECGNLGWIPAGSVLEPF